jgi:hypothetical protein
MDEQSRFGAEFEIDLENDSCNQVRKPRDSWSKQYWENGIHSVTPDS